MVGSDQRQLKVVPDAALLGTQHEGLDWGKFPATYRRHVQGVYLYIKLPNATKFSRLASGQWIVRFDKANFLM